MHIHILGICGTFMGGLAVLAQQAGYRVTGCDANVYPPMSDQLQQHGIALTEGYDAAQVHMNADVFVIGNAISRGNPLLEEVLARGCAYVSGPQWLAEHVLADKWVLAVAGTHGKTTTASMLAWLLEDAGLNPGFLIGGVPGNFKCSARLTESPFFVIEADEYDSAFCDKRSKFVHYRPRTLVLNNLEFDHADIFADLAAIETQFHHLLRTVPRNGRVICHAGYAALQRVLQSGCWSEQEALCAPQGWHCQQGDAGEQLYFETQPLGELRVPLAGEHNRHNAMAAVAAARHVGVLPAQALHSLQGFAGVKRRLEVRGRVNDIAVIDDFAHHPTAIEATLKAVRQQAANGRILAVLEPRSNTMKLGTMKMQLAQSLAVADQVFCYAAQLEWDALQALLPLGERAEVFDDLPTLVTAVAASAQPHDQVIVMSNGGFGGVHVRLLEALQQRFEAI